MKFILTENHLKLLSRLYVGYDMQDPPMISEDMECVNPVVLPEINGKRPFGNSDVYGDMLEILGMEEEWPLPKETMSLLDDLLVDLPLALTVVLRNRTFLPGIYDVPASMELKFWQAHNLKRIRPAMTALWEKGGPKFETAMTVTEMCGILKSLDPLEELMAIIKDMQLPEKDVVLKILEKCRNEIPPEKG